MNEGSILKIGGLEHKNNNRPLYMFFVIICIDIVQILRWSKIRLFLSSQSGPESTVTMVPTKVLIGSKG